MKLPITISLSRDSRSRPAACGMCTIICGAKFSVGAVLLIATVLLLYAPSSSSNLARQRALNCVSQASLRSHGQSGEVIAPNIGLTAYRFNSRCTWVL